MSGAVFAEDKGRIVQISTYRFEADRSGTVLLMLNDDVPGVVGAVGNVLGEYHINIAEWRLGRTSRVGHPGAKARPTAARFTSVRAETPSAP